MTRIFNLDRLETKVLCGLADVYENCPEMEQDTTSRSILIKKLGISNQQYDRAMPVMGDLGVIDVYQAMGDDIAATVMINPIIVSKAADVKRQANEQRWAWLPKLWWVIISAAVGSAMTILTLWVSGHLGIGTEEIENQNIRTTESVVVQENDDE